MAVLNVKEDEKWNWGTIKGVEWERRRNTIKGVEWEGRQNKISSLSDKCTSPDSDRDGDYKRGCFWSPVLTTQSVQETISIKKVKRRDWNNRDVNAFQYSS